MGLDDQVHAAQRRRGLRVQQLPLGALDVAQHQRLASGVGGEVVRREPRPHPHAVGDAAPGRQLAAGPLRRRVDVERIHPRVRHPPRHPDRVVALGAADVDDDRIGGPDGLLDERLQRLFVAADQLRDVAAMGRPRQKVHALERTRPDPRAVVLLDRVLDERAAPLAEQAQRDVELGVRSASIIIVRSGVTSSLTMASPPRNPQDVS